MDLECEKAAIDHVGTKMQRRELRLLKWLDKGQR